jgi:hypothetical protein
MSSGKKIISFFSSFSGSSVPIEIGEMDGRNAGSAVIGFVNGMYILFNFILHISRQKKKKTRFFVYKSYHSLSLSHTTQKRKTYIKTFKKKKRTLE